jgi:hypothetical protein
MKSMKHLLATFGIIGVIFAGAPAFGQTNADLTVDASYTSTTFLDFDGVSQPGGLVAVSTTFHKPSTTWTDENSFLGLGVKFTLPTGWTIDEIGTYDGIGYDYSVSPSTGVTAFPELDPDGVTFLYFGSFGNTLARLNAAHDFNINFSVHVPPGDTGTQNISAEWTYYWVPLAGEASLMADTDPAVIADNNPPPKMGTVIFGR